MRKKEKLLDGYELRRAVQEERDDEIVLRWTNDTLVVKSNRPGMHIDVRLERKLLLRNKNFMAALVAQLGAVLGPVSEPTVAEQMRALAEDVARKGKK